MSDRISIADLRKDAIYADTWEPTDGATVLALIEAVEATRELDMLVNEMSHDFDALLAAFTRKRMRFARFDFGDS